MSDNTTYRVCKKCGELLPESAFYQRSDRPNERWYVCKKCTCENHREYARTHEEKIKEISARGRAKNAEKIRERQRERYAELKDDPAHIAARKASFERNKDKYYKKDREKRQEFNRKWKQPCEKCGESRLYLIQFHHIDPKAKSFCIGSMVSAKTDKDLENEVKKCVCLCSNCHDEFHYFYGKTPKNPVASLEEYLGRTLKDQKL